MKKLLLACLVALPVMLVWGATTPSAHITWTIATTDTSGAALPAGSVTATRIYWRRKGQTAILGQVDVPVPTIAADVANLDCGSFDFTAQTLSTSLGNSVETAPPVTWISNVVCKPNPPGGLGVTSN